MVPGGGGTSGGGSGGSSGDAGADPGTIAGQGGEGGETTIQPSPDGPEVTITQPEDVEDPASGEVLTDPDVVVICRAEARPGGAPVQPSSVQVQLLDQTGRPVGLPVAADPTGKPDEYSAAFLIANVPSGPIGFRCAANDKQTPPKGGVDVVHTFFDGGPVITPKSPAAESNQSSRSTIPVEFTVEPAPVSTNDPGSEVTKVEFFVQEQRIPTRAAGTLYTGSLDLGDEQVFPNTPSGPVGVRIHATNQRGVLTRALYVFNVDDTGPVITIVSPALRQIVGGVEPFVFTVEDPSEVIPESVVVIIDNEEYRFDAESPLWSEAGGEYTFNYDWTKVGTETSQVNVNVRAMDSAMNESELGAGVLYYVDNVAPYVDLNPRWVREVRNVGDSQACSMPFDVLGDGANDLAVVRPHVLVRALVYDRTNEVPGQSPIYYSHTKPNSVRLYLQPDLDAPLLTNRRGNDDLCDDITEPSKLPFAELRFIPVEGDLPAAEIFDPEAAPAAPSNCVGATKLGTTRCGGDSDLVRVIAHESRGNVPVIYAVGTEQGDRSDLACAGVTWQLWPNLTKRREGWVCLAAVAEDAVGNRDVSPPLRLCVSDGRAPEPACDPDDAPSCTDGCDPRRANVPLPFSPDDGLLHVD